MPSARLPLRLHLYVWGALLILILALITLNRTYAGRGLWNGLKESDGLRRATYAERIYREDFFRAKALFSGIDLELSKPVLATATFNPLAETLRVKLNLVRAYITIEDFSAAKKSLEEVLRVSNSVDPTITIEAQSLLAELSHRNA